MVQCPQCASPVQARGYRELLQLRPLLAITTFPALGLAAARHAAGCQQAAPFGCRAASSLLLAAELERSDDSAVNPAENWGHWDGRRKDKAGVEDWRQPDLEAPTVGKKMGMLRGRPTKDQEWSFGTALEQWVLLARSPRALA